MRFIPVSPSEEKKMLADMGLASVEDLFASIPDGCRLKRELALEPGLSEMEVGHRITAWAEQNRALETYLGAGAYAHYVPSVVDSMLSRGEFFTAYTPYQPEISQGTLQSIFEYQSMMSSLTGEEISNASLYDGATALAESALLAMRANGRKKLVISASVHPEYQNVLRTYTESFDVDIKVVPWKPSGRTDLEALAADAGKDAAAVIVQSPNFFGVVEDLKAIADARKDPQTLYIVVVTEAMSLGLLEAPGAFGADIVTGEAQSFGIPMSFGGPYLGFITTRDAFKRHMPGRLVGQTVDVDGKRAFVLTLATREQHIRREKATSNICTNSGLNALAAAIFLSSMGAVGLQETARRNFEKAEYAKERLSDVPGVALEFTGPTFNEFVLKLPVSADTVVRKLLGKGILAGLAMNRYFPSMDRHLLVCVTELKERAAIDKLAAAMKEAVS